LAGYGTVFFVRPAQTRFDSAIDDGPGQYRIRNQGNSVVVIDEFRDCSVKSENDCQPTTKHHILPGRTFEFDKQSGREYRFTMIEGKATKVLELKG